MAKKSRGLGRGLGALIPQDEFDSALNTDINEIKKIDINLIKPNKEQPRKHFDKEKIEELSNSIKEHGVIQPLLVVKQNDEYIIVAGERRYRASLLAGIKEVPVIIRDYTKKEISEVSLIENLQREDLNEIEKAQAYNELKENFSMTQEDIAKRLGTSRTNVANTLRLLSLSDNIQDAIKENKISAGHARTILSVDESKRDAFMEEIIKKKLSVREAEKLSKKLKEQKPSKQKKQKPKTEPNPFIVEIENKASTKFGTKVKINNKDNKGSIVIDYYSDDDLNRILEIMDLED